MDPSAALVAAAVAVKEGTGKLARRRLLRVLLVGESDGANPPPR
jgi:hypothetical protein